jgi:hypothetical protein
MLWRIVTVLIVLFWGTMTTLLVRHTYFTEVTSTPVPVPQLLEQVKLYHSKLGGSHTLNLLRDGAPAGQMYFTLDQREDSSGYHWNLGGIVFGNVLKPPVEGLAARWKFEGQQRPDLTWSALILRITADATNTVAEITWKQGDELPKIEVRTDGQLVLDTEGALQQAREQASSFGLGSLISGGGILGSVMGSSKVDLGRLLQMSARTQPLALGDRQARGVLLTLSALGLMEAKASFTQDGALADVQLPQGWRLVDPLIIGLEATTESPTP